AADPIDAIPGLARKLPHYGKYSYLAFEGSEPSNVLKGRWPTVNSPLSVPVRQPDGTFYRGAVTAELAPRRALAYLPPLFSEERMMEVIRFLAAEERKGRGFGTPELDRAAEFIAARFRDAGLQPAGDGKGSYFQEWKARGGEPEREAAMKNVIAVIPGSRPEWEGQSVVVGAHYDHLGLGWPDVRAINRGKVHPGADDNASGVAVLLELARLLGKSWRPDRSVVFIAFTGEEAERMGSKFYVENERRFPADRTIGVLNLDTVGRLGSNRLLMLGSGSAREWVHIFMGAGYVTGVPIEPVPDDFGSSDQKSFLDAGVPAVQLFSGPHTDLHSPADTSDRVDSAGLVKVASVVREAVEYLAHRPEPLSSLLEVKGGVLAKKTEAPGRGRKVGLGTIPDFTYRDRGVRIIGAIPGSPAEKAGLQKGDIIILINNKPVDDLRSYSNILKGLKPGDTVMITLLRGGKEKRVEAQVVER
ncbi:MAG: M20/M25/M40 family metallo-hydrolase, partial [Thermodesulfobacteriota bacterium]